MTKEINFSAESSNTDLLMPAREQQEITQHNAMIETQISKLTTKKDAYKRISNKSLSISFPETPYTSPYLLEGLIMSITGYMIFLPVIYSDIFKKKRR